MTEALKRWWQLRTPRERGLLAAMFLLVGLLLLWLALVRPLASNLAEARIRNDAAVARLAEMRGHASAIAANRRGGTLALSEPLDSLISRSASEAGFPVGQVAMEAPDQAGFTIAAVRPTAFFAWVGQMEAGGFVVHRLSATANADRTLSVRTSFKARSD